MISITLPIRLVSAANLRENPFVRAKRVKSQRSNATLALMSPVRGTFFANAGMPVFGDLEIKLTRISSRELDGDNLQYAFKAIRDGVADALKVKDNSPLLTWTYAQEKGKPKEYAVRIEIKDRA